MKNISKLFFCIIIFLFLIKIPVYADNQTATLSPVLPSTSLPFQVEIEQASMQLPVGFHSGAFGQFQQYWIFIAGSLMGLHGFDVSNNFPPSSQNRSIFVVNSATGQTFSRSLTDPGSGLNQQQIDSLSVISPQFYQEANTLIMTGGYGIDTIPNTLTTKPILTALYLPGIVDWVLNPAKKSNTVLKNIRQMSHPIFQIAGGEMFKTGNVTQLVFGQNFDGEYHDDSNGQYSRQVRQFEIKNGTNGLSVKILNSIPSVPDPNFRRRDLNILPALLNNYNQLQYGLVAFAGVFTLTSGVWTVPVVINDKSIPVMADPLSPTTFKQAMNQYTCASISLYSKKFTSMYNIFFGGMSYGYFLNGNFETDSEVPFINQVTTVQMNQNGIFSQYIMDNQYPTIISTTTNPGNPLLFGAGAYFVPNPLTKYPNGVLSLDNIRAPVVIGYIVGGIASTVPNTSTNEDSFASPYIFKVTLIPRF